MESPILHRKERIILTTIDLIDELGINSISTREIAKREGVTEGALFKHFPTKNDLIQAVLEHFSQFDQDIYHSVRLKSLKGREAIIYCIDNYLILYENYPAITALTQVYDVLRYNPNLADRVKEIYAYRITIFKDLLEEAVNEGLVKPGTDIQLLADMIIAVFQGFCLKWRLGGYVDPLREEALKAIHMVLEAFMISTEDYPSTA